MIDSQLGGGKDFHGWISRTAPLLFTGVGLILGILIQYSISAPMYVWLAILGICAVGALVLFFGKRTENKSPQLGCLAFVCFVCLGAIRMTSYSHIGPNDIANFVGEERRLASVRGIIATEPYVKDNNDWAFGRFKPNDPQTSFYLKVKEVEAVNGWVRAEGLLRVQVNEPVKDLKFGDFIMMYCWLERFNGPGNPGQFDMAKYLARKNAFVGASVDMRDGIEVLDGGTAGLWRKLHRRLKNIAVEAAVGEAPVEESGKGLLEALLLGYRSNMGSGTFEAFRETGLAHFICLSGFNFAILIGVVWWLCKTIGLRRKMGAAVCMFAAILFLLVIPPQARRCVLQLYVLSSACRFSFSGVPIRSIRYHWRR